MLNPFRITDAVAACCAGPFGGLLEWRSRGVCLALAAIFLLTAAPCTALDGRVDVEKSYQEEGVGPETFRTETLRETASLGQTMRLAKQASLRLRFFTRREQAGSRIAGVETENESRVYQPDLTATWRTRMLSLGAGGLANRRETFGPTGVSVRFDRYRTSAWGTLSSGWGARLSARWDWGGSWREDAARGDREGKDRTGSATAGLPVKWIGDFNYKYSELSNELVTDRALLTHRSHVVGYGTSRRLPGNFLSVSAHARSRFFEQITRRATGEDSRTYLIPISGGVRLDNTPEEDDPLEPGLQPVPGLYDRNRTQATGINLGDSAPPGDRYGGDYRNIQFDLEDEESISEAVLYVDRIVTFADLYEWRIFASDDPQGLIWTELGPAAFDVAYEEWSTGEQGWVVTFPTAVATRYFKMVDVKLGESTSQPDLFVTELEVYTTNVTEDAETRSDTENHEIGASATLSPASGFRLGYDLSWRKRIMEEGNDDRIEEQHGFSSSLQLGSFLFSTRHGIHTLETPTELNTDILTHGATATAGRGRRLTTTLSWSYSRDRSEDVDNETTNSALRVAWKATPALDISQGVNYGTRDDFTGQVQSKSVTVTTRIRSQPVSSLRCDLDWDARRVDAEAGTGFSRHNDARVNMVWSPVSLVSVSSRTRYQVRDDSNWNTRNQITWSPFHGGEIEFTLSGMHYFDSRDHSTQSGVSSILRWRPRPRLSLEGRWTIQRFEENGEINVPASAGIRITWTL